MSIRKDSFEFTLENVSRKLADFFPKQESTSNKIEKQFPNLIKSQKTFKLVLIIYQREKSFLFTAKHLKSSEKEFQF